MKDIKFRSGFRVVGKNTSDGELTCWAFPTLDDAKAFAAHMSAELGEEVDVHRYLGSVRPARPPTEWVSATDAPDGEAAPPDHGAPDA